MEHTFCLHGARRRIKLRLLLCASAQICSQTRRRRTDGRMGGKEGGSARRSKSVRYGRRRCFRAYVGALRARSRSTPALSFIARICCCYGCGKGQCSWEEGRKEMGGRGRTRKKNAQSPEFARTGLAVPVRCLARTPCLLSFIGCTKSSDAFGDRWSHEPRACVLIWRLLAAPRFWQPAAFVVLTAWHENFPDTSSVTRSRPPHPASRQYGLGAFQAFKV